MLPLWDGPAPGSEHLSLEERIAERSLDPERHDRAVTGITRPTLTHVRAHRPSGAAVILIPGGAYQREAIDKESALIGGDGVPLDAVMAAGGVDSRRGAQTDVAGGGVAADHAVGSDLDAVATVAVQGAAGDLAVVSGGDSVAGVRDDLAAADLAGSPRLDSRRGVPALGRSGSGRATAREPDTPGADGDGLAPRPLDVLEWAATSRSLA